LLDDGPLTAQQALALALERLELNNGEGEEDAHIAQIKDAIEASAKSVCVVHGEVVSEFPEGNVHESGITLPPGDFVTESGRGYIDDACEQIDAAMFSGDAFIGEHGTQARAALATYLRRWAGELYVCEANKDNED